MVAEVIFGREKVGDIVWEADAYGVRITLDCTIPCDPLILLRCYGTTPNGPFLIGLPEPRHGRLKLTRKLSRETLKEAGCLDTPPSAFYLADSSTPPPEPKPVFAEPEAGKNKGEETITESQPFPKQKEKPVHTGDELLDMLLESGTVQAKEDDGTVELSCTFSATEPFALAPVFALCTVRDAKAVLRWQITGNSGANPVPVP